MCFPWKPLVETCSRLTQVTSRHTLEAVTGGHGIFVTARSHTRAHLGLGERLGPPQDGAGVRARPEERHLAVFELGVDTWKVDPFLNKALH